MSLNAEEHGGLGVQEHAQTQWGWHLDDLFVESEEFVVVQVESWAEDQFVEHFGEISVSVNEFSQVLLGNMELSGLSVQKLEPQVQQEFGSFVIGQLFILSESLLNIGQSNLHQFLKRFGVVQEGSGSNKVVEDLLEANLLHGNLEEVEISTGQGSVKLGE